jgi:hypothetical protein
MAQGGGISAESTQYAGIPFLFRSACSVWGVSATSRESFCTTEYTTIFNALSPSARPFFPLSLSAVCFVSFRFRLLSDLRLQNFSPAGAVA